MSKLPKRTKKPKSKLLRKEARAAYLYLIPAFIGLIVLTYIPLIAVFGLSFFKWGGTGAPEWNGINNYIKLFTTDPYFKESIKVTVYFSLLAVVGSMVYSLIVAMLLNRKIPARGFFRAVFYLPYVLPAAAVYIGWSWLYNTEWGLFNYILSKLGIERLMFVSSSSQVVPSLALIAVWLSGNLIVIFLAGLQNVPRVYHEAAEIDGANAWQRFWHVTFPSMTPIIFYKYADGPDHQHAGRHACPRSDEGRPRQILLLYVLHALQLRVQAARQDRSRLRDRLRAVPADRRLYAAAVCHQ